MKEVTTNINIVNPLEIFGVNNSNLNILQSYFPNLKIAGRGNEIKVKGELKEVKNFQVLCKKMLNYIAQFNTIDDNVIEDLFLNKDIGKPNDIIVYGVNGLIVRTKTINQRKLVDSSKDNSLLE